MYWSKLSLQGSHTQSSRSAQDTSFMSNDKICQSRVGFPPPYTHTLFSVTAACSHTPHAFRLGRESDSNMCSCWLRQNLSWVWCKGLSVAARRTGMWTRRRERKMCKGEPPTWALCSCIWLKLALPTSWQECQKENTRILYQILTLSSKGKASRPCLTFIKWFYKWRQPHLLLVYSYYAHVEQNKSHSTSACKIGEVTRGHWRKN